MKSQIKNRPQLKPNLTADELALCAVITRIVARTVAQRQKQAQRGSK